MGAEPSAESTGPATPRSASSGLCESPVLTFPLGGKEQDNLMARLGVL